MRKYLYKSCVRKSMSYIGTLDSTWPMFKVQFQDN